jgi:hypothetical protein
MNLPYYPSANAASHPDSQPSPPLSSEMSLKSVSGASTRSSFYSTDVEKPAVNPELTVPGAAPHVSTLARRIHGWSWQAVRLPTRISRIELQLTRLFL